MLVTGCEDDILSPENPSSEEEHYNGDKVMLAAGTTENTLTTRADAKTYYMPAAHRFVCQMYFKTNESGLKYDTLRYHTAWLKVDNDGEGNSLYWKNTYPETAQREDRHHNDEFAPTFYWQNRKEHAFLAWTDLNHATTGTAEDWLNYTNALTTYAFHTQQYEEQWVEKTITVRGEDIPLASERDMVNRFKDATNGQTEFKTEARDETPDPAVASYYWYSDALENFCKVVPTTNAGEMKGTKEKTSNRHLMYFFKNKLEYVIPEGTTPRIQTIVMSGTQFDYVIDEDNTPVARKVTEGGVTKYYKCTSDCHIMYDEDLTNDNNYTVFIFRRNLKLENVEIVNEYPAMAFDLSRKTGMTSMADQPDVLQALTIDQIPTSAVMENNRVRLFFKHQFAQVQVNIKNSVDNSVQITEGQIKKVELLGVTNTGYMFSVLNSDGTIRVPTGFGDKTSTFKEVVATDYNDEQLQANPYGTSFDMFNRTLTDDDRTISKIVRSFECITFGRLQAIRITWKEEDYTGSAGNTIQGIEHVATYRVPEKNEQDQEDRCHLSCAGEKRTGTSTPFA